MDYMYDDRFGLYNKLNDKNSFDYSWFINFYEYDYNSINYEEAYIRFKQKKMFGNNFSTNLGWRGLADCMIEHIFERLPFGICKKFNKEVIINNYSDDKNLELNNYIYHNIEIYKKPIILIACHTNSEIKLKSLIYNISKLKYYTNTIYIINSNEYKNLIEPYFLNNNDYIINLNLNDTQTNTYLNTFPDIKTILKTTDKAKEHYKNTGFYEQSRFNFLINNNYINIIFEYYENNNLICHYKWFNCLKNIDINNNNFILTNDSYLLVNDIKPFFDFCRKNYEKELIGLLDSNQTKYHYPDFLRCYSPSGIKKWIDFYKRTKNNCNTFYDMIINMEIESTYITNNIDCLFKMNKNYLKNIHFDNNKTKYYIEDLNYPIIKLKRLKSTIYEYMPDDFDPLIYKDLNIDLKQLKDNEALHHFINTGIDEGRLYKKNQEIILPKYIENKVNNIFNNYF